MALAARTSRGLAVQHPADLAADLLHERLGVAIHRLGEQHPLGTHVRLLQGELRGAGLVQRLALGAAGLGHVAAASSAAAGAAACRRSGAAGAAAGAAADPCRCRRRRPWRRCRRCRAAGAAAARGPAGAAAAAGGPACAAAGAAAAPTGGAARAALGPRCHPCRPRADPSRSSRQATPRASRQTDSRRVDSRITDPPWTVHSRGSRHVLDRLVGAEQVRVGVGRPQGVERLPGVHAEHGVRSRPGAVPADAQRRRGQEVDEARVALVDEVDERRAAERCRRTTTTSPPKRGLSGLSMALWKPIGPPRFEGSVSA